MTDLRTRIAAAIYEALREQHDGDSIDAPMVTPEIGGDRFTGYATIDGEVNLMAAADAVIRELKLEALELLARSWYRNYDIIPANDPRCPTDMDIAYDDAGEQILRALGLLQ